MTRGVPLRISVILKNLLSRQLMPDLYDDVMLTYLNERRALQESPSITSYPFRITKRQGLWGSPLGSISQNFFFFFLFFEEKSLRFGNHINEELEIWGWDYDAERKRKRKKGIGFWGWLSWRI